MKREMGSLETASTAIQSVRTFSVRPAHLKCRDLSGQTADILCSKENLSVEVSVSNRSRGQSTSPFREIWMKSVSATLRSRFVVDVRSVPLRQLRFK